uniref:Taste receptor type 2 n=1 Tax=Pyxicephalus adspersus TaxID=30357 RepID=A0AAV3AN85_PYXAD|nr:TPA: hypothetical protein GDO54_009826 [Pyxicephalus adspersus]
MNMFSLLFLVIAILGMPLNGFIVVMNCRTWMRKRCLPPGDQIVTSLCLSQWIFQGLSCVYFCFHVFLARVPLFYVDIVLAGLTMFLNYLSIWFASLLSVYYCVKLSSYKHVVFLYPKRKMSKMVPWCIGLSGILSLLSFVPFGISFYSQNKTFHNITRNTNQESYTYLMGSSPPFIIFTIAFLLTIPSLWRHIRNMRGVGSSFRSPDMKIHYNAIKSMAAFFLLHIVFIVCVNIQFCGLLTLGTLYSSLTLMVAMFYPMLHSAVIIFYNRNLRQGVLLLVSFIFRFGHKIKVDNPEGVDKNR